MNIFTNIFNAFKNGAIEIGEPIVDKDDIQSFETSIAQASLQLSQAKQHQRAIEAKHAQCEALIKKAKVNIRQNEVKALAASESGNEQLALNYASQIISENENIDNQQKLAEYFYESLKTIDKQIASLSREITEMKAQLSQVKATDAVLKVQSDLSSQYSSLPSAKASLAKIKEQQAHTQAKIDTAKEMDEFLNYGGSALDERIAEASGANKQSAKDLLAKLKSQ